MPESNVHRGDDELGGCQSHSHYHNVFCPQTFVLVLFATNTFCNFSTEDVLVHPVSECFIFFLLLKNTFELTLLDNVEH